MSRYSLQWPPKSGRGPAYLTILGNVSFVDNIAGDNGGAIYASGSFEYRFDKDRAVSTVSRVDISGAGVFSGNNALGSYGGAISIEGRGILSISGDVRFQGNRGLVQGGAVHYYQGSEAHISGRVVFEDNYAPWGGALFVYATVLQMSDAVHLSNNSAQVAGGVIVAVTGSVIRVLDDVTLFRSSAQLGGAVYLDSSALVIAGRARLADNRAETGGMAYLVNSGSCTVTDSAWIGNNQAESEGGGIFVSDASLDMSDTVLFAGNRAGGSGGAIAARAFASVRVAGSASLVGNTARNFGGAIDADASVTLRLDGNSSLKLNRAANGGGLSLRKVNQ